LDTFGHEANVGVDSNGNRMRRKFLETLDHKKDYNKICRFNTAQSVSGKVQAAGSMF